MKRQTLSLHLVTQVHLFKADVSAVFDHEISCQFFRSLASILTR
ncbi:MAG: hypothetical protein WAW84_00735 [Candidatus Rickettsiella isopodorum]